MKSYMHVRLAIVDTCSYNLNVNIKNQDSGHLFIQLNAPLDYNLLSRNANKMQLCNRIYYSNVY